jgi:hypothetical protein
MVELEDTLVLGTSAFERPGASPGAGTIFCRYAKRANAVL